ncbi:Hypothetical protein SMAX5B_010688 [Scophthalmus maximus]|uniref:Uncharacterized protein n=1 Tax=Scophthalmus maximus TaxID=52904 RepID=A0A2U9CWX1_SCOMX|nr:Hypothetical protein SMAX5B_010688 [Scophthalmus maximus]
MSRSDVVPLTSLVVGVVTGASVAGEVWDFQRFETLPQTSLKLLRRRLSDRVAAAGLTFPVPVAETTRAAVGRTTTRPTALTSVLQAETSRLLIISKLCGAKAPRETREPLCGAPKTLPSVGFASMSAFVSLCVFMSGNSHERPRPSCRLLTFSSNIVKRSGVDQQCLQGRCATGIDCSSWSPGAFCFSEL